MATKEKPRLSTEAAAIGEQVMGALRSITVPAPRLPVAPVPGSGPATPTGPGGAAPAPGPRQAAVRRQAARPGVAPRPAPARAPAPAPRAAQPPARPVPAKRAGMNYPDMPAENIPPISINVNLGKQSRAGGQ